MAVNIDCKCGAGSMTNFSPGMYACKCGRVALTPQYPNHSDIKFPLWLLTDAHESDHGVLEETLRQDRQDVSIQLQNKADERHRHSEYAAERQHYHYKSDIHNL